MNKFRNKLILSVLSVFIGITSFAQENIILDQIVAIVGGNKILLSEVEQQAMQMKLQGYSATNDLKCEVLEELLGQKLLIDQARIDSIEVSQMQIGSEIDRRINYFIANIGSEEAVEEYFNKSLEDIIDDLRKVIGDQMLTQQMQTEIVKSVFVTPTEVKKFFREAPKDSLPLISEQMEIQQIVLYPQADDEAKLEVRKKLLSLRERILNGEKFATLAILYSEDLGSAKKGGDLGYSSRSEFVKPFSDAAFNLKVGQVSQIVETEFGFHIIQLIDRKDDKVNCRHILLKPKITPEMISAVKSKLDSIANLINSDSVSFKAAARYFSEDEETRMNGGIMINPYDRSSKFEKEHLSPAEYYVIRDIETGVISAPFEAREESKVAYKIIRVNRRIETHRANMDNDYDVIVTIATNKKKTDVLESWLEEKRNKTYIKIGSPFNKCTFKKEGWIK